MSSSAHDTAQRPTFFEGQIVAATDLNGVVETARAERSRHERYMHTWGIAEGLELSTQARQTSTGEDYVEVNIEPGLATDGTGRHLLVPSKIRLSEGRFKDQSVETNDPEAFYPVFLIGRDAEPAASDAPLLACSTTAPTRVDEVTDYTFGRVDSTQDPDNEEVDSVSAGPGGDGSSDPWKVLIGFVQWNTDIDRFNDIATSYNGVSRVFAGVRADQVVARGGTLALRSKEDGDDGAPIVEIDANDDPELRFGLQKASGGMTKLMTVNANGDLHVEGKITGAIAGGTQMLLGSVSDGALVPLMTGITQEKLDSGEVTIQVSVTPRYGTPALPIPAGAAAGTRWFGRPLECRVDGRRVYSRMRWEAIEPDGSLADDPVDLPSVANFTLIAFTSENEGG